MDRNFYSAGPQRKFNPVILDAWITLVLYGVFDNFAITILIIYSRQIPFLSLCQKEEGIYDRIIQSGLKGEERYNRILELLIEIRGNL